MTKKEINSLKLAVTSSLNLMILDPSGKISGTATGVLVVYEKRYFFCTVEHVVSANRDRVAILTGEQNGDIAMTVQPPNLSLLNQIRLSEISASALEEALTSAGTSRPLDIAFTETQPLSLNQQHREVLLDDGQVIEIPEGKKLTPDIGKPFVLSKKGRYVFAGRINTHFDSSGNFNYTDTIVKNLRLSAMDDYLFTFDLGHPIGDHSNYQGCSGAPVFDSDGHLVALFAAGDPDTASKYVYGFRIDRLRNFIRMNYFNESLDKAIEVNPFSRR